MKRRFYSRLTKTGKIVFFFVCTLFFFLFLLFAAFGIFNMITAEKNEGTMIYRFGTGSNRDKAVTVERSLYYPDGVYYFNFTELAEACSFPVSGDESRMRFLFTSLDERLDYVTFFPGSARIDINGTAYFLNAPVRRINGVLYVPCEFITHCMNGVSVENTADQIRVVYNLADIALHPDLRPLNPIDPGRAEESSAT